MVQEVQTGVGITNETTLETIEAIGTSSFKIVEGRQTRGGHYTSNMTGRGAASRTYVSGEGRNSGLIKATISISEMTGKSEFSLVDGGVRVPNGGTYQISFDTTLGGSSWSAVLYLKSGPNTGDKTIRSKEYTASTTETITFQADLGKFDIVTVRFDYTYNGGASQIIFNTSVEDLKIQQL